jgi:hypothetical protein
VASCHISSVRAHQRDADELTEHAGSSPLRRSPSPRAGDLGVKDRYPAHPRCSPVHDAPAIVSRRWALAAELGGADVGPGRRRRAGGVAQRNRGRRRCWRNAARKETHGRRLDGPSASCRAVYATVIQILSNFKTFYYLDYRTFLSIWLIHLLTTASVIQRTRPAIRRDKI